MNEKNAPKSTNFLEITLCFKAINYKSRLIMQVITKNFFLQYAFTYFCITKQHILSGLLSELTNFNCFAFLHNEDLF